jgi:hypothetical protein
MNPQLIIDSAIEQFREYKLKADRTFDQLQEKEMYFSPDKFNNSIAVNIMHLHGNMVSRWTNFLTEDGEKPWRKRDEEFKSHDLSKDALLQLWEEGWKVLFDSLGQLNGDDLDKTVFIRSKPLSVIQAVHRQLCHVVYHVGQIVFLGKNIRGEHWKPLT